jgi:predicted oxidoreductase
VEIMLLHRPDPLVEPEEVARAFDHMHASGKVRYFGVSNHTPWQVDLLKKHVKQPLVVNQLEVNVIHNYMISEGMYANMKGGNFTASSGMMEYSRLHDMTIQAWSPVARGEIFNPKPDAPANIRAVAKLVEELAAQHSTTREAIALAWLLRHPAKIQPILGTMNPERIIESVKADDVELSRIEWYNLLAAANGRGVP